MDDVGVPADSGTVHARRRRARVLATAAAVVLLLSGASTHVPHDETTATVGVAVVRPAYQGHYVTTDDVATLQAQGRATTEVLNRELVCQGVELYFDTPDERDAYLTEYAARFPVEPPYLAGDPCSPYRDSPRYVAGG